MSTEVVRFPARRSAAIWLLREGAAWPVLVGENGWLHGSSASASDDAQWLAQNLQLPIRVVST
jgi:hypothetical protein